MAQDGHNCFDWTRFRIVFDLFSFLHLVQEAKECFLKGKYPLQQNISLLLPLRILLFPNVMGIDELQSHRTLLA